MRSRSPWLPAAMAVLVSLGLAALAGPKPDAVHGFDPANLDKTCKPCENFYQFADGGWMAKNPIPASYPSWGSFNELSEKNREVLHKILEDAAKNTAAPRGSNEQKIGDYYAACMDTEKVESDGLKPLGSELDRIERIQDLPGLEAEVARLQMEGVDALFRVGALQDFKNSTQMIGGAFQGGLGLPDRDYYTKTDDQSKQIREKYIVHVRKMLELMGDDTAKAAIEAQTIMSVETKLAEASMTRVERRDPNAIYHKMALADLKTLTPHFAWGGYLQDIGASGIHEINIGQPNFFKEVDEELTAVKLADWKTYLRWHLIDDAAPRLSSKFVDEDFDFKDKVLRGTKEILPRWKRCVTATDRALGEALGQVYVEKTFSPEAKARARQMVGNLIAALRDDLSTLPWMGPETRKQAIAKLEAFMPKIGYPDKWRDYSALQVDRGPYVENVFRADRFEFRRDLAKIGKPVDRTEWGMTPPTVNAYYNPSMNEIVFPAGILQPPFYDPEADDAINYGGIGAVIGHEMTHGFDDQGAKFDGQGNLKNWWSPDDLKSFQARAGCVEKQFDSFEVEPKLHENGKLVLGESIADLGGLTIAYVAFQRSLQGKPAPKDIDGFSSEQRFFLGWAQVWADNIRPEYARLLVNTDPHPLARFRANGPLSNMPAFAKAFACKPGDPMVRPATERCQVW